MNKQLNIEEIINENIDVSKLGLGLDLELELVGKEYSTPLGRIDILCKDETGGYVPIEVKVGTASDSAIGQILRYMHTIDAKYGIIMANDFTKGVRSISHNLNILLIPYTIDVIIDNKSIAYSDIDNDIGIRVKRLSRIYPNTYAWFGDNIRITGDRNDRISTYDIIQGVLKYSDEIRMISKNEQYKIARDLLDFAGTFYDGKITCKNINGKQNLAIGGIIWKYPTD